MQQTQRVFLPMLLLFAQERRVISLILLLEVRDRIALIPASLAVVAVLLI